MYDRLREIDEAIAAGREALEALEDAADSLDSAKRWGIVDILGGGLITSVIKHSRLATPTTRLADAREALARFSAELDDVRRRGRAHGRGQSLERLLRHRLRQLARRHLRAKGDERRGR